MTRYYYRAPGTKGGPHNGPHSPLEHPVWYSVDDTQQVQCRNDLDVAWGGSYQFRTEAELIAAGYPRVTEHRSKTPIDPDILVDEGL